MGGFGNTTHGSQVSNHEKVSVTQTTCFNMVNHLFKVMECPVHICSTKLDLRFSLALCDKEKEFRRNRRDRVMLGIKKLLDMEKLCFQLRSPEEVWKYQL